MNAFKKNLMVLGCLILATTVLTGCGKKKTAPEPASELRPEVTRSPEEEVLNIFAESQVAEIQRIAETKGLHITAELQNFMQMAKDANWIEVYNDFEKVKREFMEERDGTQKKAFGHALYQPTLEIYGAAEQVLCWNPDLLERYATEIENVITPNAIFFGGTDPGRFVQVAHSAASKKPFYIITQNQLTSESYVTYEREDPRNAGIWLPSGEDVCCVEEQNPTDRSVQNIMKNSGLLAQQIFEHNKGSHDFFLEESYAISWMFPYLEPCGPIMKFNAIPTPISEEMIAKDRTYWDALSKDLLANPDYRQDFPAQKAFSKLRNAIAGLYAARGKPAAAEYAFRQAVELYPGSAEATFRLVHHLQSRGRSEDALEVIDSFIAWEPAQIDANAKYANFKNKYYKFIMDTRPSMISQAEMFRERIESDRKTKSE
jgi:tetratricopeptide (TPR) repeat protein